MGAGTHTEVPPRRVDRIDPTSQVIVATKEVISCERLFTIGPSGCVRLFTIGPTGCGRTTGTVLMMMSGSVEEVEVERASVVLVDGNMVRVERALAVGSPADVVIGSRGTLIVKVSTVMVSSTRFWKSTKAKAPRPNESASNDMIAGLYCIFAREIPLERKLMVLNWDS